MHHHNKYNNNEEVEILQLPKCDRETGNKQMLLKNVAERLPQPRVALNLHSAKTRSLQSEVCLCSFHSQQMQSSLPSAQQSGVLSIHCNPTLLRCVPADLGRRKRHGGRGGGPSTLALLHSEARWFVSFSL